MKRDLCRIGTALLYCTSLLACCPDGKAQKPIFRRPHRVAIHGEAKPAARHNVILFVADGLRRSSVTAEDMPTFLAVRTRGVDFRNSHSVFPTFTTANASAIATGHGLGDTGDFSNVIWPGEWLTRPEAGPLAPGLLTPFLENDEVLADLNVASSGNYLGEETLLEAARQAKYNIAAIGKIGPTAIQVNPLIGWDSQGGLSTQETVVIDDATGGGHGLPIPAEVARAMEAKGLGVEAPLRSNGYGESSPESNGFSGDALTPGTRQANRVQQQWLADVATEVVLPRFAAEKEPFLLMFWSRDPDATQHNQGDSLQQVTPGINGPTSQMALHNADRSLKQLLDWLHAHPALEATTDVLLTSDHGFATISRREIAANGTSTGEPSAALDYELAAHEKPEPKGTLPSGFLAVDLAIRQHLRAFDATRRAVVGPSVYAELNIGGEKSQHPDLGSALLSGKPVQKLDGSDAALIVAANGGSDLIYAPTRDEAMVRRTVATLGGLDYVGALFADESLCGGESMSGCPGALPLSAIGLAGSTKLPTPAIVVSFKVFYLKQGDLRSALQISDSTLQEGQGMHGGFGREQTWNNMAAMGPDFKGGFVDDAPVGNVDIAPTLASVMGFTLPSVGKLRGRVAQEAFRDGKTVRPEAGKVAISTPGSAGLSTVMEYQELDGVRYLDRACFLKEARSCE